MPFLAIPFLIVGKRKKETFDNDIAGNKIRRSNALARKYLGEAKKHLGNKEPFYIALEKAMHNFLKAKLRIENGIPHLTVNAALVGESGRVDVTAGREPWLFSLWK